MLKTIALLGLGAAVAFTSLPAIAQTKSIGLRPIGQRVGQHHQDRVAQ